MKIETNRLVLREMTRNDFDSLYAVLADSDIMQHYPYSFDENRVNGWIERNIERYRIFGFGLWAVCLKETGEMIGDCGKLLNYEKDARFSRGEENIIMYTCANRDAVDLYKKLGMTSSSDVMVYDKMPWTDLAVEKAVDE